jgi:Zn-dependent protease/CBS domain-containing protein
MNGSRGFRIGRVAGIDLAIDYSWLFIVVLLTWNLTMVFLGWHPHWSGATAFATAMVATILFFASVLLHELAHSLAARRFGLPVRNITLFLFGGVSDIEREPQSPKVEFLMAAVGPLTSIALGAAIALVALVATNLPAGDLMDPSRGLVRLDPVETILAWLGPANVAVGVFNLIPGFPLDGGRMLRATIWHFSGDAGTATRVASSVGQGIGWVFVVVGFAAAFGARVPGFGAGLASGLWLAFIGWFLAAAAAQTWKRQVLQQQLEGMMVSQLMRPAGPVAREDLDVATFVSDQLMRSEETAFLVIDAMGKLVGLVTLGDVKRAPREAWDEASVADVMTPAGRLVTASPREDLAVALDRMVAANVSQLPVLDDARLVGTLLRRDVVRWIGLHSLSRGIPRRGASHR